MATQIEVLKIDQSRADVAFYYPVTAIPGTADPARIPRSVNIQNTPAELQAFRNGEIIEVIQTLIIRNLTTQQKKALAENAWADGQAAALVRHTAESKDAVLAGKWFNGTGWAG